MKFALPKRWSWSKSIEVEISADLDGADSQVKIAAALKVVCDLHSKWRRGEDGGSRADLRDADLRDADLSGADLSGADLSRADLRDADLRRAVLSGADLRRADLRGADLSGADLRRADLRDADLRDADLSGADLSGADLSRADLRDADLSRAVLRGADLSGAKLVGDRPILTIGPIGSESRTILIFLTDHGVMVRAGCFFGDLPAFRAAVDKRHAENTHGKEYRAAIVLIEAHAELWTPAAKPVAAPAADAA